MATFNEDMTALRDALRELGRTLLNNRAAILLIGFAVWLVLIAITIAAT